MAGRAPGLYLWNDPHPDRVNADRPTNDVSPARAIPS